MDTDREPAQYVVPYAQLIPAFVETVDHKFYNQNLSPSNERSVYARTENFSLCIAFDKLNKCVAADPYAFSYVYAVYPDFYTMHYKFCIEHEVLVQSCDFWCASEDLILLEMILRIVHICEV